MSHQKRALRSALKGDYENQFTLLELRMVMVKFSSYVKGRLLPLVACLPCGLQWSTESMGFESGGAVF